MSQAGYCNHRGHTQARISSLLAFLTDLWKLKEEAIAKQGKAEVRVVVLVMDGSDDDGDEKYHRRWEMEVALPHTKSM